MTIVILDSDSSKIRPTKCVSHLSVKMYCISNQNVNVMLCRIHWDWPKSSAVQKWTN